MQDKQAIEIDNLREEILEKQELLNKKLQHQADCYKNFKLLSLGGDTLALTDDYAEVVNAISSHFRAAQPGEMEFIFENCMSVSLLGTQIVLKIIKE